MTTRRRTVNKVMRRASAALATCVLVGAGAWVTTDAVGADDPGDPVVFSSDGTYVVPDGVTSLRFTVTGAGGGGSASGWVTNQGQDPTPTNMATAGGDGATETGLLAVAPGEVLSVVVGRAGGGGTASANGPDTGGVGGSGFGNGGSGGDGVDGYPSSGGGGGGSAILSGSTPLVVAGGGGGAAGSGSLLVMGIPLNYFGSVGSCIVGAETPCPTTSTTTPPPPAPTWVAACPGLAPNASPTAPCPTGPSPADSADGTPGVDAKSDVHQTNGAGGGGGGGFTGGAGGIPTTDSLTTGGGQGGTNFVATARTSDVTDSSTDNAGGTDDAITFCAVSGASVSAESDAEPDRPRCATTESAADDGEVALTPVATSDPAGPSTNVDTPVSPAAIAAPDPSTQTPTTTEPSTVDTTDPAIADTSTLDTTDPTTTLTNTTAAARATGAPTDASAATPVAATPRYTG